MLSENMLTLQPPPPPWPGFQSELVEEVTVIEQTMYAHLKDQFY